MVRLRVSIRFKDKVIDMLMNRVTVRAGVMILVMVMTWVGLKLGLG
jgi:hypothetical protein